MGSGATLSTFDQLHVPVVVCCCLQDVMMPDVDGLDILRYVRSNAQLADLPVISECQQCSSDKYGSCITASRSCKQRQQQQRLSQARLGQ
jgi:CheY-like chemotaxis protein